ncbi:hypothetical protein [Streptomyces antimycoticus]|uniref:hypothetical protein n=1 Tax=Streptomyces antimycoticus TaxID=68175 RepID=UPI00117F6BBE|nr:hypothetical protein [Streptomyces antimycoticus]
MAPAFVVLGFALVVLLSGLVWLYGRLSWPGLLLGLVLLAGLAVPLVRRRRAVLRRRRGYYRWGELQHRDEQGLAEAAARMLRRDGWRVRYEPWEGTPRLLCRDESGRRLDVTFRPGNGTDDGTTSAPAPLRAAGPAGLGDEIRLVVSTGAFSRGDVLWSSRQGGVHLLDGHQLQQWADGTSLGVLLGD